MTAVECRLLFQLQRLVYWGQIFSALARIWNDRGKDSLWGQGACRLGCIDETGWGFMPSPEHSVPPAVKRPASINKAGKTLQTGELPGLNGVCWPLVDSVEPFSGLLMITLPRVCPSLTAGKSFSKG